MKKVVSTILLNFLLLSTTAQIPVLLKDIYVGGNSSPINFTEYNGKTFFTATNSTVGTEIFVTDGTESGTIVLKDIVSGVSGSAPNNFIVFKGRLFFTANDFVNGLELWVTDGTPNGTVLFKNISPFGSASPTNLTIFNDSLYFVANDGINGNELWVTDGTSTGTFLLKDIYPGNISSNPSQLTVFKNKLYFYAFNNTNGGELWQTDGTALGTVLFKDIRVGLNNSNLNNCYVYNGSMFFSADNGINGPELWVTDGTSAGTVLFLEIQSGSLGSSPVRFNTILGKLFFIATTTATGSEPWISDGTVGGTQLLKDIKLGPLGSTNQVSVVYNNKLFFGADNGSTGLELWSTDGTIANTKLFKDVYPGLLGFNPNGYIIYNSDLYLTGQTSIGTDLYRLKPAMDSLYFVTPFSTFPINPNFHTTQNLKVCNNFLFYSGSYTSEGNEPFVITNFPKILATNTFNTFYTFIDSTTSSQSINIAGLNLIDSVKISVTPNFEISTNANGVYSNSIVLAKDSMNQVISNLFLRFKPTYKGPVIGELKFKTVGIDSPIYLSISGYGIDIPSINAVGVLDTFKTYIDSTSIAQIIQFSGSHLNDNLTIKTNGSFKVSLNSNSDFSDSLTLIRNFDSIPKTNIFIRFYPTKKGIEHSNVEVNTLGASSILIPLVGNTLPKPFIKIQNWFTDTFLSLVDQYSFIKKFEIEGDDLLSEVGLIASAHFELSNDSNDFAPAIRLTPTINELKKSKLFVRFKSNTAGFFNGTLKIYATGIDTQTYVLKGISNKKVGIDKLENMTYSVSPNPFVDELNIAFNQAEWSDMKISIYDIQGNEVDATKRTVDKASINISTIDFAIGVYFLHIENESIQRVIKLVKY